MEKYTINDVLVGIVTYNPNIGRLKQCLDAIVGQITNLVIFDNGSTNIADVRTTIKAVSESAIILESNDNKGIATALSEIMLFAKKQNYRWVLTLDQDSVLQDNIVDCYINTANNPKYFDAGMFTCLIKDRNFIDTKYEVQSQSVIEVEYCITSAAFTNTQKYFQTDGYDKKFFIDCVDFDICYSLNEHGFKIYRINKVGILHEVGHGEQCRFLGKKIIVYHEKPLRLYYLTRNTIWLYKKHSSYKFIRLIKKELAILIRILLYEDNRRNKLKAFIRGIQDSRRYISER